MFYLNLFDKWLLWTTLIYNNCDIFIIADGEFFVYTKQIKITNFRLLMMT